MKKLFALSLLILASVSAEAQTIAIQRAQHNAAVCASADLAPTCTPAEMIVVACGGVPAPESQAQYDACVAAMKHFQKVYTADAAFRTADDAESQKVRLEREKHAVADRVQRRAVAVLRAGGANCVSLLNLLGQADTSICSR